MVISLLNKRPFRTVSSIRLPWGLRAENPYSTHSGLFHTKTGRTNPVLPVFGGLRRPSNSRVVDFTARMPRRPRYQQHQVHSKGVHKYSNTLQKHLDEDCEEQVQSMQVGWTTTDRDKPVSLHCPFCGEELVKRFRNRSIVRKAL